MPIQTINLGTYANDGTGDDLRSAFTKVNENFDYLNTNLNATGTNLGAGAPVFKTIDGTELQFRTITGGTNLTVSYDGNTITVAANNPFVGNVTGNVSGNAGTVTNGVYTTSSINALADVDTSTTPPTDGQALVWNTVASQWKPGTISGGGGGGLANIVEDTTPQLGGNLDVNGSSIVSANNGNITIAPNGTGIIYLTSTNYIQVGNSTVGTGNLRIIKNGYSSAFGEGFYLQQYHDTPDSININYTRARGTFDVPTILQNGDDIVDLGFSGYDGVKYVNGCGISVVVEGSPRLNHVPAKFSFATNNGTATAVRAELSAIGTWKVNTLSALSGSTMSVLSNISIGNNFSLSVGGMTLSQDGLITSTSSNQSITIRSNGIGNVAIENISITSRQISTDANYPIQLMSIPQLPSFADETAANAAVGGLPVDGMMYYDAGATAIKGYGNGAWHTLW